MDWKFNFKENKLSIDEYPEWTWKEPDAGEFKAFEYTLERQATVFMVLENARQAFATGTADYKGASAQIGHLVDESNAAAYALRDACAGVERWFDGPESLVSMFEGKADTFLKFCREWIAGYKLEEGLRKNSPRERTGNSPVALPATAVSAVSSSSPKKGKLRARA